MLALRKFGWTVEQIEDYLYYRKEEGMSPKEAFKLVAQMIRYNCYLWEPE